MAYDPFAGATATATATPGVQRRPLKPARMRVRTPSGRAPGAAPIYETSEAGWKLATGAGVPARKGYCAESVEIALGHGSGHARALGDNLRKIGYTEVSGTPPPGAVVTWQHFGNRGWGYTYGHTGIVAYKDGQPGYFSNLSGRREWNPLGKGWRAFVPSQQGSVVAGQWSGRVGRTVASGSSGRARVRAQETSREDDGTNLPWERQTPEFAPLPSAPDWMQDVGTLPVQDANATPSLLQMLLDDLQVTSKPFLPETIMSPLPPVASAVSSFDDNGSTWAAISNALVNPEPSVPTDAAIQILQRGTANMLGLPVGHMLDAVQGLSNLSAQLLDAAMNKDLEDAQKPWRSRSLGELVEHALWPTEEADRWGWPAAMQEIAQGDIQQAAAEGHPYTVTEAGLLQLFGTGIGLAGDVVLNPLSWTGFGTSSLSRPALRRAALRSAARTAAETMPEVETQAVRSFTREWLDGSSMRGSRFRGATERGLWSDVEAGGTVMAPHTEHLAAAAQRKLGVSAESAQQFATRLTERLRRVKLAPVNVFGYPVPQAAKARDRARLAVGARGLDYRLADDPLRLGMRERMLQRVRTAFGIEPLVPFQSQNEAFYWPVLNRYYRAEGALAAHYAGEIPAEAYTSQAQRATRIADDAAERALQETGQTRLVDRIEPEAAQAGWSRINAKIGAHEEIRQSPAAQAARALEWAHPEKGMPRPLREAMHSAMTGSTYTSTTLHGQVEEVMRGLSETDRRLMFLYSNNVAQRAGSVQALGEVLVGTREVASLEEAERIAAGAIRADGTVHAAALQRSYPRAARIVERFRTAQQWFDRLYPEDLAYVKRLRAMGVRETREPGRWADYTPIRIAQGLDGAVDDFARGRMANTPAAEQAFQRLRQWRHGGQMFETQLAEAGGDIGKLDPVISDYGTLMHVRASESVRLRRFAELRGMVEKYCVHINHPDAEAIIKYADARPFPRMFAERLSPQQQARAAESLGENATALHHLHARMETSAEKLEAARETLRQTRRAAREVEPLQGKIGPSVIENDSTLLRMNDELASIEKIYDFPITPAKDVRLTAKGEKFNDPVLRGRTWHEMTRGKSAEAEDARRVMKEHFSIGGSRAWLGINRRTTRESIVEFTYALHDGSLPEELRPRLISLLRNRYGFGGRDLASLKRWERAQEYIDEFGEELCRGELADSYQRLQYAMEQRLLPYRDKLTNYELAAKEVEQRANQAYDDAETLDDIRAQVVQLRKDLTREDAALRRTAPANLEAQQKRVDIFREAIAELEGEAKGLAGKYGQRLTDALPGETDAVRAARAHLVKQRRRLVRDRAAVESKRVRFAKFGEGFNGMEFEPALMDWLVPPAVYKQFRDVAAADSAVEIARIINQAMAVPWARGNLLANVGFHVSNLIDNWVVGRWLAGQILMFAGRNAGALGNAATAWRVMARQALRDFAWITPEEQLGRIATWRRTMLQRIAGGGDPVALDRWAREISRMNIAKGGMMEAVAGGGADLSRNAVGLQRIAAARGESTIGKVAKFPIAANAKVMEVSRELGQVLEDVPRVATYITARQNGFSPVEAKRLVDASFVGYMSEIRKPLDDFFRQTMTFWPYTRQRTEQVLTNFFRHPWQAVALHSAGARMRGDRERLGDTPLPWSADVNGQEGWTESQQFLFRHGLKGGLGFLRGGYVPVRVERDDNGEITGWAGAVLRRLHVSPEMIDAASRAKVRTEGGKIVPGDGTHYLFMRTHLSPFEIMETMQAMTEKDLSQIKDMAIPPIQVFIRADQDRRDDSLAGKLAVQTKRQLAQAYLPGSKLWRLAAGPRAVKLPKSRTELAQIRYQGQVDYERLRADLIRRQRFARWFGMSFFSVPEDEMMRNLKPRELEEYERLAGEE